MAGYAPEEFDLYSFGSTCADSEQDGMAVSCEQETLADGSTIISSVAPYTDVTNTTKRLIRVAKARKHPENVLWARSFSISTRDGVTAGISELVRAESPETAAWLVPAEVLREIATDPDLLEPRRGGPRALPRGHRRLNAPGVVPSRARKCRVRWDWSWNPVAAATSAMGNPSRSSRRALSSRRPTT